MVRTFSNWRTVIIVFFFIALSYSACAQDSNEEIAEYYENYFDNLSSFEYKIERLDGVQSEGGFISEYYNIPGIRVREITFLSSSGRTINRLYQSENMPDLLYIKQFNYDPFEYPGNIVIISERYLIAIKQDGIFTFYNGNLNYESDRISDIVSLFP